ncbi:MAG: hypothetical protein ACTHZ5_13670, partial [Micrococcaceae bacterium]
LAYEQARSDVTKPCISPLRGDEVPSGSQFLSARHLGIVRSATLIPVLTIEAKKEDHATCSACNEKNTFLPAPL